MKLPVLGATHAAEDRQLEENVVETEQVRAKTVGVGEAVDEHVAGHPDESRECGHEETWPTVLEHPVVLGLEWPEVRKRPEQPVNGEPAKQDRVHDGEHHGHDNAVEVMRLERVDR